MAAGYQAVIPASWGDELIAARAIDRVRESTAPVVHCACPFVTRRLSAHGDALGTTLLCLVPPPVAAAQYLRALYAPAQPRITYAGGCPGAAHDAIDVWMSPEELLGRLVERGVSLAAQPREFDSVIPPDRRRYYSDPGGVPSRQALRQLPDAVDLVELKSDDVVVDLAELLLSGTRALIDVSLSLGCCCSGAVAKATPEVARARVREQEPPRALSPIVDHAAPLALDETPSLKVPSAPLPRPVRREPITAPRVSRVAEQQSEPATVATDPVPRRRSPTGLARPVLGSMPLTRADSGRTLPRAYVARRRSPPRGGSRPASWRNEPPSAPQAGRRPASNPLSPMWIGAIGVAVGLVLALLLRLLR